jgi:transcriptional regulator with XRE-family HTH domain
MKDKNDIQQDLTDKVKDVGMFIREQRNNARMSLRKLAKTAGVSNPYLSQIERGIRKPSAEILQAIARGLKISAEVLYVRAGILERTDSQSDVEVSIMADTSLKSRQREVMIDLYRSFVGKLDVDDEAEDEEPKVSKAKPTKK